MSSADNCLVTPPCRIGMGCALEEEGLFCIWYFAAVASYLARCSYSYITTYIYVLVPSQYLHLCISNYIIISYWLLVKLLLATIIIIIQLLYSS